YAQREVGLTRTWRCHGHEVLRFGGEEFIKCRLLPGTELTLVPGRLCTHFRRRPLYIRSQSGHTGEPGLAGLVTGTVSPLSATPILPDTAESTIWFFLT